jgi:hypothetical protein
MSTVEERIQGGLAEVDSNHRRGEVSPQILSGVEGLEVDIGVEGGVLVSHNRCRRKVPLDRFNLVEYSLCSHHWDRRTV